MSSFETIAFRTDDCDGCMKCVTACAQAKSATNDPVQSRLQILGGAGAWDLALCRQCADPKCVSNCPAAALAKDSGTGVIAWDADQCVNCLLCTVGCAYAGITYDARVGHVSKCDLCDGDPACVTACPTGALTLNTAARIHRRVAEKEDLFAPGLAACQGCNSELLIRHTLRHVGPNTVVATPPGCIPGMGTVGYNGRTGTKVPVFHPLLTNTASMLTGIKRYYKRVGRDDVQVLALAGDGGSSDAGFQSLSGAAERDEPMLYICVDNEGYMNTGMQASSATTYGSWTSTTPVGERMKGKATEAKNLPLVMMMHNCSYVATAATAFLEDFYEKLDRAIEVSKTGMAYLHVFAPCPTGWRFGSDRTTDVCRLAVETNFFALWDYTPDEGLGFTRPGDRPRPVRDYLTGIGKYRHLNEEQVRHIQATVERKVAQLRRFQRAGV